MLGIEAGDSVRRHTLRLVVNVVLASFVVLVAVSCTGDDSDGTDGDGGSQIPPAGRLLLTGDGCFYIGEGTVPATTLSLSVENQTSDSATFDLWKLNDGHTFDQFAAHVQSQQEGLDSGADSFKPPAFAENDSTVSVGPDEGGARTVTIASGNYAFSCAQFDDSDAATDVFAAGPLQAT